jgi:hypothetical protein
VIRWSLYVYKYNKYCCCWLERVMLLLELCLDALQVYELSCLRPASLRLRPFFVKPQLARPSAGGTYGEDWSF